MTIGELLILFNVEAGPGLNKTLKWIGALTMAAQTAARAGHAIVSMVENAAEMGTHLLSYSTAMGLSVEKTQEWGYVAQQSGSNLKEFTTGVSMFARNLRLVATGQSGKQLNYTMRELGLTTADAADAMSGPDGMDRVLLKVADKLSTMKGSAEAAALAAKLFGARAGRAMAADLERGSAAIEEMRAHFKHFGGELNEDQVKGLRGLDNAINDLKLSFGGLVNQLVARLAPTLTDLAERTAEWIVANREVLSGALKAAVDAVVFAFEALGVVVRAAVAVFGFLGDHSDAVLSILTVVAGFIIRALIPSIIAWTISMIPLVTEILLVAFGLLWIYWPMLLIGVAIAAVIYVLAKLAGGFKNLMSIVWEAVKWILDKLKWLAFGIFTIPALIISAFHGIGDRIKEMFGDVWEWIKEKARGAWAAVKGVLFGSDNSIVTTAANAGDFVKRLGSTVGVKSDGTAPVNAGAGAGGAGSDGGGTVTHIHQYGETTVTIDAKNADANGVKQKFDDDRAQRERRHAQAALGGGDL